MGIVLSDSWPQGSICPIGSVVSKSNSTPAMGPSVLSVTLGNSPPSGKVGLCVISPWRVEFEAGCLLKNDVMRRFECVVCVIYCEGASNSTLDPDGVGFGVESPVVVVFDCASIVLK